MIRLNPLSLVRMRTPRVALEVRSLSHGDQIV